jgi:hypothetical protein
MKNHEICPPCNSCNDNGRCQTQICPETDNYGNVVIPQNFCQYYKKQE